MLSKSMRKKFMEHNLLYILNHDSNKSQLWRRIRDDCLQALGDLSIVAMKTPNDKLYEFINEKNLEELLNSLFMFHQSDNGIKYRHPDVKLASILVRTGVLICIREYKKWNKDTPESAKPTIDYLYKSITICNEIGYKSRLNMIEEEATAKKLEYICIWEDISGKDEHKIGSYIINNFKPGKPTVKSDEPLVYDTKIIVDNRYEKEFHLFEFDIASVPEDGVFVGKVRISISPLGNTAKMIFYDIDNQEIKSKNLVIKKYGDSQTALFE